MSRQVIFSFVMLMVASVLLGGCATPGRGVEIETPENLVWPAPPQPARIQWIKEIRTPQDHGIRKGFWASVSEKISGVKGQSISKPYGVHADDQGRLFVVDSAAGIVHILDPGENEYRVLGTEKTLRFEAPIGVTEDHLENLYVTDSGAGLIYRYSIAARTLEKFTPFKLKRPTGIAFSDRQQLLFVSDTLAHQVVVFDLTGKEQARIGHRGAGDVQFNYPTDLFVDQKGQLYVTDALNQRVQILTPEGQLISKFGEGGDMTGYLAKPKGVAVDSQGHIYVCDALLDAVQIFDSSGQLLMFFGGTGRDKGEFWMPTGIDIDSQDNIYVSDSFNNRIQMFRYVGERGGSVQ